MSSDDDLPLPRRVQSPTRPRPSLKKRAYGASYASAHSNSSDGPFFSSDDLEDASAENYASPRRKKQFKRTWWQPESSASSRDFEQARREAKPPKDSGVFMSDNSSVEDGFSVAPLSSPPRSSSYRDPRFSVFSNSQPTSSRDDSDARAYEIVASTIDDCLESGGETVDLSSCLLGTVPNELLLRLQHLIRPPRLNRIPPDEESYQSLAPSIKLYLSSNALRVFPGAIGRLENISVLSLRNNKITELPSSIGRLNNLVELNLAGNRLRWLPYDLLRLRQQDRLVNITLAPNPLLKPFDSTGLAPSCSYELNIDVLNHTVIQDRYDTYLEICRGLDAAHNHAQKRWHATRALLTMSLLASRLSEEESEELQQLRLNLTRPVHVGNTAICYLELDGRTPIRSCPAPPSSLGQEVLVAPIADKTLPVLCNASTNLPSPTPSLYELAIRACVEAAPVDDILALLPEETPGSVLMNLERARQVYDSGGQQCSTCQRRYVVPRAEWLEYWHIQKDRAPMGVLTEDKIVPFLRRACSWACAKPTTCITRRYKHTLAGVNIDLECLL